MNIQATIDAIEILRNTGRQFGADVPGMILFRAKQRLERELTAYLTGEKSDR